MTSDHCSGHGECINGRCECEEGYGGNGCQNAACPNDCSGHGICQERVCQCRRGWTAEDCNTPTCPNQCSGNGRCVEGECYCEPAWTELDCSEPRFGIPGLPKPRATGFPENVRFNSTCVVVRIPKVMFVGGPAVEKVEVTIRKRVQKVVVATPTPSPIPEKTYDREAIIAKLQETFDAMDHNGDGNIDALEILNVFKAMGTRFNGEQAALLISLGDTNGDMLVNFAEFVKALSSMEPGGLLDQTLRSLDKNGDGRVSVEELRAGLQAVGAKLTEDQIQSLITEYDTNKDGTLSVPELLVAVGVAESTATPSLTPTPLPTQAPVNLCDPKAPETRNLTLRPGDRMLCDVRDECATVEVLIYYVGREEPIQFINGVGIVPSPPPPPPPNQVKKELCPNMCSGHGVCLNYTKPGPDATPNYQCQCQDPYIPPCCNEKDRPDNRPPNVDPLRFEKGSNQFNVVPCSEDDQCSGCKESRHVFGHREDWTALKAGATCSYSEEGRACFSEGNPCRSPGVDFLPLTSPAHAL